MATITHDTLDWYGRDEDGGSIHDVIGPRCDLYTNFVLKDVDYHDCCHSNPTRALSAAIDRVAERVERFVHNAIYVFMSAGFTRDTH